MAVIGIEYDDSELLRNLDKFYPKMHRALKDAQVEVAEGIRDKAIEIISNFIDSDGHRQGVDTGTFINSIHLEELGEVIAVMDGVDYGIYHEYGTEEHWLPLMDSSGNLTPLGEWAYRKFDDLGWEPIGKRGKSIKNKTMSGKMEAIKRRGWLRVSLDEMAPFRTAQIYMDGKKQEIVRKHIDAIKY